MRAIIAILILAAIGLMPFADACTVVVVGKGASATGRVIVGHNEDNGKPEWIAHSVVPAADWPKGCVLPAEANRCQRVPQVAHTLATYWMEVKFGNGDGCADVFCNEKGVLVVSDSGGRSRERDDAPDALTEGGVGYLIRRAVGERATSARDAVRIIGELVETFGYAPSARIYTVADQNEAWLVQIVHGRNFCARRCPDDEVTILPNCYSIRRLDAIEPNDLICSRKLRENAKAKGFWDGVSPFDFAAAYQGHSQDERQRKTLDDSNVDRYRKLIRHFTGRDWPEGRELPFSVKAAKAKVGVDDVKCALSRLVSSSWTIESAVCEFAALPVDVMMHVSEGSDGDRPYRKFRPFRNEIPTAMNRPIAAARLATHVRPLTSAYAPLVSIDGSKIEAPKAHPGTMIFWERSRSPEILKWYELNEFGKAGEVGELAPLKWYVNPNDRQAPIFLLLTLGDPARLTEDQLPLKTIFARHYSVVAMDVSRWPNAATRAAAAIRAVEVVRRDPRSPIDFVIIAGEGEAATAAFWAMANCKGIYGGAIKNERAKAPVVRAALFAACAPRPIEVGIDLAEPTAEAYYWELVEASKAYPLFGVSGLDIWVWPGDQDYVNRGGKIGFHCLKGAKRGLCRTDWMRWMDYYDWQGARGLSEPKDAMPDQGIPDLLAKADGTKAKTVKEWERDCKARIKEFFASQIYGRPPAKAKTVKYTTEGDEPIFGGLGFRRTVRVDVAGPHGDCSFHILADIPSSAKTKAAPGFVWIPHRKWRMISDDDRKLMLSRGYALVQFLLWEYAKDYEEFAPERNDWASRMVFGCFEKASERKADSWGCITAWAWGASRSLDWMETQKELDAKHVGIAGLSRGGKTALWTGVSDERFAMVCPCCSGCMGPRLHRLSNPPRETFWLLQCLQSYWFCPNAAKWGDYEEQMPWDMNALVACIAPRIVVVTDGSYDHISGPVADFHSARLASPVWELYGLRGLNANAGFPTKPDTLTGDLNDPKCRVYFNYHLGGHATMTCDWNRFMDIADTHGWK